MRAGQPEPRHERFEIRRRLGQGSSGVVYEALDRERATLVALKTLHSAEPDALYRFKQEFRALADVTHPNLAALYELHAEGDPVFFSMELVRGAHFFDAVRGAAPGSTASWLPVSRRRPAPIDPAVIRDRTVQLAHAVAALHRAGRVHRDLKHSNVLVEDAGRVVVLDFGLVTELGSRGLALTQDIAGTPPYMSPEQLKGERATSASDWYSVGLMLYEVLCGTAQFRGTHADVLTAKLDAPLPPVRTLAADAPADLAALCDALVDRDPARRPSGAEVLARLGAPAPAARALAAAGEVALIGRERELRALHEGLARTHKNVGVLALVHGASGIGKSALVRRFLDEVKARDPAAMILQGRCYERESVPFKALDGVVDTLGKLLRELPDEDVRALLPADVHALARLFPILGLVPAVAAAQRRDAPALDLVAERRRAFAALRELLVRLAASWPLVVVIDDLQWGDVDSAALLDELLRTPGAPAFLLIGVYRDEEQGSSVLVRRLLASHARQVAGLPFADVSLAELAPEDARRVARHQIALAARAAPDEGQVAAVARESGGHPFFIDELVRFAFSGAALRAGATLDLKAAIAGRCERLPDAARHLLEVTALASRPLDRRAAAAAARIVTDDEAALATLKAGHLVRFRTEGDRMLLEAYHDRIRETVVERLSPEERRFLHAQLAAALEKINPPDPEALAHHLLGAGDVARAATFAADAAERAMRTLAFHRAARLYEMALAGLASGAPERRALEEQRGRAHKSAGSCGEAAKAFLAAAALAPPTEARDLRRQAAELLLLSGHTDDGAALFSELLAPFGIGPPRTSRWTLPAILLRQAWLRVRGIGFTERSEAALDPDTLFAIDLCRSVSVGLATGGADAISSVDFQERYLTAALGAGEPHRLAHALAREAMSDASGAGITSAPRVSAKLAAAGALVARLGDPHLAAHLVLCRGVVAFFFNRFRDALRDVDQAETMLHESCTGTWAEISQARFYRLGALFAVDAWGDLDRSASRDLVEGEENGDAYIIANCQLNLSRSWLMRDAPDRAAALVDDVRRRWSRAGFHLVHWLVLYHGVHAALYAGDVSDAERRLREAWRPLTRALLLRVRLLRVYAHQMRATVSLALAAARPGQSRAYLAAAERDARVLHGERLPWADARALLVDAAVAVARGEREKAVALLRRARAASDAGDLAMHAALADLRLGVLVAGEEGAALVARGEAWMRGEGIVVPARIAAMLAPLSPAGSGSGIL